MPAIEEITTSLLLALSFLEKADKLGASTKSIQNQIEYYLENQANAILAQQEGN